MQNARLGNEYKYDLTSPAFLTAFEFLHREDLSDLPEGWVELPHGVRASIQRYLTTDARTLEFETHEHFFDIQYLVFGTELIGIAPREELSPSGPYDPENDVTFYAEPTLSGGILLRAGDFAVICPEDAHKPRCAAGGPQEVRKIVVKVPT